MISTRTNFIELYVSYFHIFEVSRYIFTIHIKNIQGDTKQIYDVISIF